MDDEQLKYLRFFSLFPCFCALLPHCISLAPQVMFSGIVDACKQIAGALLHLGDWYCSSMLCFVAGEAYLMGVLCQWLLLFTRFCCCVYDFAYAVIASEHDGGKARWGIKGSTCVYVRTLFKRFMNLPWLLSMKEVQRREWFLKGFLSC